MTAVNDINYEKGIENGWIFLYFFCEERYGNELAEIIYERTNYLWHL